MFSPETLAKYFKLLKRTLSNVLRTLDSELLKDNLKFSSFAMRPSRFERSFESLRNWSFRWSYPGNILTTSFSWDLTMGINATTSTLTLDKTYIIHTPSRQRKGKPVEMTLHIMFLWFDIEKEKKALKKVKNIWTWKTELC